MCRCLPSVPQSFVDSMVIFVNRRVGALVEVLSPKDAAFAFARRLRQYVQAHDATTMALGIRAGRKLSEGLVVGEGSETEGVGQGELEEHDVQVRFFVGYTWGVSFTIYSRRLRLRPLSVRTWHHPQICDLIARFYEQYRSWRRSGRRTVPLYICPTRGTFFAFLSI